MFVIGQINPNVGDQRRKALAQKLLQQFGQQQGLGMPGQPAMATNLMPSRPAFGTAVHGNSRSGVIAGAPQFTGSNFIPGSVFAGLGPGGQGRTPNSVQSPAAGIPIPGLVGHPILPGPPPSGPPIPTPTPPIVAGPPPGSGPNPSSPIGPQLPTTGFPPTTSPTPSTSAPSNLIGAPGTTLPPASSPVGGALSGAAVGASAGLVPLGNGIYYNPASGAISGAAIGGLGGAAFGLGGGGGGFIRYA